jgi:hypothetical protein
VEVYTKGSIEINSRLQVQVIQRNRIKTIAFNSKSLLMPINGTYKLPYTFEPANADNANTLRWHSTNNQVLRVDSSGELKAVDLGECDIILSAEGVAAKCHFEVMPVIEDIRLSQTKLNTYIGVKTPLTYSFSPQSVYSDEIKVNILDDTIAAYHNGQILPKSIGSTIITFQSAVGKAKASCEVNVKSSFEKKQEGEVVVFAAVALALASFLFKGLFGIILAVLGIGLALMGASQKKTITMSMIIAVGAGAVSLLMTFGVLVFNGISSLFGG